MTQFQLGNPGNNTATITSVTLTASGTGSFPTGITSVNLYLDNNGNGVVDSGDTLVGTATYIGTTAIINLTTSIPAGSTKTILVTYQFSNSATNGSYTTTLTSATGTNATGAVQFSGLPLTGATIFIVTATSTPTSTSTVTSTSTPTSTPTPLVKTIIKYPYPNPVDNGPVVVDLDVPGPSTVEWSVFTLSFRKILGGEVSINSTGSVVWDLKDKSGAKVADGIYYLRIEVQGPQPTVKIFKILVLH